jgi:predicted dehydrogenase
MGGRGPEIFHPNPAFFYEPGAGPMFDMGPYYLTALIHAFGPIARVTGAARMTRQERTILSEPLRGQSITVKTPTHIVGLLEFAAGPLVTLTTSFDIAGKDLPEIEVFGTEGTLVFADPNFFEDPIRLYRLSTGEWETFEGPYPPRINRRGLGVVDMANAIREGRPHRASGDLAYHVLETMHAILDSAESGQHVTIESTSERPEPLPAGIEETTGIV